MSTGSGSAATAATPGTNAPTGWRKRRRGGGSEVTGEGRDRPAGRPLPAVDHRASSADAQALEGHLAGCHPERGRGQPSTRANDHRKREQAPLTKGANIEN